MHCNRIILFISLFVCTYCINAQEVYFKNISDEINLPSEECYNVVQDKRGFMWITTERGVLKLSGTNITTYNVKNSPFDGAVYGFLETSDSTELFLTSKRTLIKHKDGVLEMKANLSKGILRVLNNKKEDGSAEIVYSMTELSRDKIIITGDKMSYLLNGTGQFKRLTHLDENMEESLYSIHVTDTNAYFLKSALMTEMQMVKKNWAIGIEIIKGTHRKRIEVDLSFGRLTSGVRRIAQVNGYTYFAVANRLIIIDPDLNHKVVAFPTIIIALYSDKNKGLWVGLATKGANYYSNYRNIDPLKPSKVALQGLSVSGLCEDREGNLWCTTLEKGVFFSMNSDVLYYPESVMPAKKSYYIKNINGKIYTSSEWNELFIVNGSSVSRIHLSKEEPIGYSDIEFYDGKFYVSMTGVLNVYDQYWNYKYDIREPILKSSLTVYDMDQSDNKMFMLAKGSLYRVERDSKIYKVEDIKSRPRCLKVVSAEYLLYGCNDGLYKYTFSTGRSRKLPGVNAPVTKIEKVGAFIAIATRGQGIGFIRNDSVILQHFNILPDDINDLEADKNGVLWLASNKGIYRYDLTAGNAQRINRIPGLPSSNINKIAISDSVLYASSYNGLFRFSILNERTPDYIPDARLKSISVNKSVGSRVSKEWILPYDQNTIDFTFDVFTFRKGENAGVYYKLSPFDTTFYFSKDGNISYQNLAPGKYMLSVYTTNASQTAKRDAYNLQITIQYPFWKKAWFMVLLTVTLLVGIYFIVRILIRRVKKREEEKFRLEKQVSDSQLSALQAQMNPHFIFNAINSIQNYILNKDEKQAYDYLAKFSRLIRKVLNNSRQRKVSLIDEAETLQLYVEIEQLRFEHAFNYNQSIDARLYPDRIFIPTMLIQPYVENAIWHGLNNLKGARKGELSVSISLAEVLPGKEKSGDCFLFVIIDDNGIGREKANTYKANNAHRPAGMTITKERMELVNKLRDDNTGTIKITDKYNEKGEAEGTKVELWIKIDDNEEEWIN